MRKARLALTALMIGTLTVTGASFAEANVVDNIKIILNLGNDKAPARQDKPKPLPQREQARQPERKPAPKPVHDDHDSHNPGGTGRQAPKLPEHHEPHKDELPPRHEQHEGEHH